MTIREAAETLKDTVSAQDRARMEAAQQDSDLGMTPANAEPLPF